MDEEIKVLGTIHQACRIGYDKESIKLYSSEGEKLTFNEPEIENSNEIRLNVKKEQHGNLWYSCCSLL